MKQELKKILVVIVATTLALFAYASCGGDSKSVEPSDKTPIGDDDDIQGGDDDDNDDNDDDNDDNDDLGAPCGYPSECIDGRNKGDCIGGYCVYETPARCETDANCVEYEDSFCDTKRKYCARKCELDNTCSRLPRPCQKHRDCPDWMSCHEGRCINDCQIDSQCPPDGHCIEGQCIPYPPVFTGEEPKPQAKEGETLIGVAVEPFNYPIGVSCAGYGGRKGPSTPYNVSLGGSDRVFEAVDVRVVVVDNGKDILIFLRLPLGWSTDFVVAMAAKKLQDITGVNYYHKIVTGSTHSHSLPARFWNLVTEMGFGIFGYDEFSYEMFHRYTDSLAEAMVKALENRKPGKVGWAIEYDFDPDDKIMHDRRGEYPAPKDNRIALFRFDDNEGNPLAVLVSFGMHGTIFNKTWITGDAPGAVEVAMTKRLSERFGYFIPALFFNGNGGDIAPGGGGIGDTDEIKIQVVGERAADKIIPLWEDMATESKLDMEVVSQNIPISYELVGYEWGEFYDKGGFNEGKPYFYGAFQCLNESGNPPDDDPDTKFNDGELNCLFGVEFLMHYPVPQFHKTRLSVFKFNDLVVATAPGESHSTWGMNLNKRMEDKAKEHGVNITAWDFGYSQNHHQYIMEEDDFWQGGYEPSMDIWGWKFGGFLQDEIVRISEMLYTPEKENTDIGVKPMYWPEEMLWDDTVALTETPAEKAGIILLDAPAEFVRSASLMKISWIGGHTGAGNPYIYLEKKSESGEYEPFIYKGLPYDNSGFETITIYEGDWRENHTWSMVWEERPDFPLGIYRWKIVFPYWDGEKSAIAETQTSDFTVLPIELKIARKEVKEGLVGVEFIYGNNPSNDDGVSDFTSLSYTGHLLKRDAWRELGGEAYTYSPILGSPLEEGEEVSVRLLKGDEIVVEKSLISSVTTGTVKLVVSRTGGVEETKEISGVPVSRIEVSYPEGEGIEWVEITDKFGNMGRSNLNE
ncbi:MAG: hypothetical protein Kow0090_20970 [Myxococcota bacterium]